MIDIRTEEQKREDAMKYGLCLICGKPRGSMHEIEIEIDEDGIEHHSYELVCPNGHSPDPLETA